MVPHMLVRPTCAAGLSVPRICRCCRMLELPVPPAVPTTTAAVVGAPAAGAPPAAEAPPSAPTPAGSAAFADPAAVHQAAAFQESPGLLPPAAAAAEAAEQPHPPSPPEAAQPPNILRAARHLSRRAASSTSLGAAFLKQQQNALLGFTVQLDDNKTTFVPGQRIEGHVALSLQLPCEVKLLRVRFTGCVVTHIQKRRSGSSNDHNSAFYIFKEIYNLLGSGQSSDPPVVADAADHIFPFAFRVPPTSLPATFEGPYGEVRYEVTAVLLRVGLPKMVVTIPITIPSTLNVNSRDLQQPISVDTVCRAGRFWWSNGHIDVRASLPRNGFSSEETAPLKIEIVNHSGSALIVRDIALKQRAMYKTFAEIRGPRTERIHKINFSERIPGDVRKITRLVQFPVPSAAVISPTIFTPILQVTHVIGFKIQSAAPWSSVYKIQLPVIIAGFPFTLFDDNLNRRSVDTLPLYERDNWIEAARGPDGAIMHDEDVEESASSRRQPNLAAMLGGVTLESPSQERQPQRLPLPDERSISSEDGRDSDIQNGSASGSAAGDPPQPRRPFHPGVLERANRPDFADRVTVSSSVYDDGDLPTTTVDDAVHVAAEQDGSSSSPESPLHPDLPPPAQSLPVGEQPMPPRYSEGTAHKLAGAGAHEAQEPL
ncbi:hypothetical protein HK105_206563 [Polyrhizophydium stewartii]|uniref:Arrestin C-terminal-like domain-containing protein n=1 Tax=Polyrhizophydium stewartii TaxID=2732419 RepID=A0ABR4N383_9FUNG